MVKSSREKGGRYRLVDNKGLLAMTPFVTVAWFGMGGYAIMKLIDPSQAIGQSWIATILWWMGRTPFYWAGDTFQPHLLRSLLLSQRNMDDLIRSTFIVSYAHMAVCVMAQFAVIPVLVMSYDPFDPSAGLAGVAVYLVSFSVGFFFLSLRTMSLAQKIDGILEKSYQLTKDEKTNRIKIRLYDGQSHLGKQAFIQAMVYMIFGGVPFFWRYHAYLLPCSWIMVNLASKRLIGSIVQEDDEKKSTGSGGMQSPDTKRKQLAAVAGEDNDSSANSSVYEGTQKMHVYGLDLYPELSNGSATVTVGSSEAVTSDAADSQDGRIQNHQVAQVRSGVSVRTSPAMRVIRAMTPSKKKIFNFDAEEVGLGDNERDGEQHATDSTGAAVTPQRAHKNRDESDV